MNNKNLYSDLVADAFKAREFAYTPYSNFKVGAALLTNENEIFHGCNIESAAYSPTNCAERTAFFKAVSCGNKNFKAIAIVGGFDNENKEYCYPCGVCRQVMLEFCDPDKFIVIVAKTIDDYKTYKLVDLIPFGFGPKDLIL